jgi:hypothetical protein
MDEAADCLQRWITGHEKKDLDMVMSCWHPDVDTQHMLRRDRSWHGNDVYRRAITRIWEKSAGGREVATATAVSGNMFFLETMTYHADGSVIPCVTIAEVEDGMIRRARVYTDVPSSDGKDMDSWVHEMNE